MEITELSRNARILYNQLCMHCNEEGKISIPKAKKRLSAYSEESIQELIKNKFIRTSNHKFVIERR